MRELTVVGLGELAIEPDWVVYQFKIVSENENYDQMIADLNHRSETLRYDLTKIGYSPNDLKSTHYQVEPAYQFIDGKSILNGYQGIHQFKLETHLNQEELNTTMRQAASSNAKPEFTVHFEVHDQKAYDEKLLEQAVNEAKKAAKLIASTAKIKLGKILSIQYDDHRPNHRSPFEMGKVVFAQAAPSVQVIPDVIKDQTFVTMSWDIEDIV